MSQNKNMMDIINAIGMSFIVTVIMLVGKDVIQILNAKIEKLNKEVERLNFLIDNSNQKHSYHLKEIEASYKTKMADFEDKYNTDMLAVNANIVSQIDKVRKHQDITIEKMFNIPNKEIGEFSDTIEELNLQMSGVHFNISSIMGRRDEDNTSINNELFKIRSKIKELEEEMPVFIGNDSRDSSDLFVYPKNINVTIAFGSNVPNINCLKKFSNIVYLDFGRVPSFIINGNIKSRKELSNEDKTYIKQICDEQGIRLDNAGF